PEAKSEIRNSKSETNPKSQIQNIGISSLEFVSDFGFRVWNFGFCLPLSSSPALIPSRAARAAFRPSLVAALLAGVRRGQGACLSRSWESLRRKEQTCHRRARHFQSSESGRI